MIFFKTKTFLYINAFLAFITTASLSTAQVIVSDAILEFKNEERLIRNIAVGNSSNDKSLQIHAQVTEIINPAASNSEEITTTTVFTVPKSFSLSPKTQRTVRLVSNKRPENKERIFRIVFNPTQIKENEERESGLSMLTTVSVMMILNPPNPIENLVWRRTENKIIFTNNGNTNIVLRRKHGQCAKNIACTIEGQRLWAGDKWHLKLPKPLREEDINLEMRVLGEIKEIVIPYEE